jgi:diguanylate cyclase (GGDEF)-like protein
MNKIKTSLKNFFLRIKLEIVYDDGRQKIMFVGLNVILCIVAFTMSIVNIFTKEYTLMWATLIFAVLCLINVTLIKTKINKRILYVAFVLEAMALICFFFISGIPNGFSALWACLIPSFALLFFGVKKGSLFSLAELLIIIFLFWIPFGQSLLQFSYTSTFLLRFPFLYITIYLISLLVELIRSQTQKEMIRAQEKYHFLYRHDALTGLYNRYGFNELVDSAFKDKNTKKLSMILIDIDNFKVVNDKYGHLAGDEVLKQIAHIPQELFCEHCNFCRWGGEEFLILMKCDDNANEMAEKIRSYVEKNPIKYQDKNIKITISLGVVIIDDVSKYTGAQAANVIDRCLYKSKENGKNMVTSEVLK